MAAPPDQESLAPDSTPAAASPWEFRVLGPLEARHGGETVSLGGQRQRALLAVLLLNANHVVSRERLISRVWHDEPFIGPRTVDVHVAWLPQKLEENPQVPPLHPHDSRRRLYFSAVTTSCVEPRQPRANSGAAHRDYTKHALPSGAGAIAGRSSVPAPHPPCFGVSYLMKIKLG